SAPTAIKRFQRLLVQGGSLLTGDALRRLIVFDFNGAQPVSGALGGATKAASIESYPFSAGLGISLTVGFLEPCGINTPHVHPRAAEFLVLVQESSLRFGSVLENGLVGPEQDQEIAGVLSQFEGTIFPQGSIHYQFNDACEKAVFVAALDSDDPGTSSIAQNLFSLDAGVLNATLGYPKTVDGRNYETFRKAIPANLAQDVGSCLARC
ncbi:RmlC-like cupin, partial [Macroventuria anomochaeta]